MFLRNQVSKRLYKTLVHKLDTKKINFEQLQSNHQLSKYKLITALIRRHQLYFCIKKNPRRITENLLVVETTS